MDQAIKAKWIAALRSGQYEQGQSFLRNGDKYCCLGVLCDIIDSSKWTVDSFNYLSYDGRTQRLTDEMLKIVGFDPETQCLLMHLNDTYKKSFNNIADYIEREL